MARARNARRMLAGGFLAFLAALACASSAAAFPKEGELLRNPQKVVECTTCHNPHGMPNFSLASQCQSCHTQQKKEFATHIFPMYLLALLPLMFMAQGIRSRYLLWRAGAGANRLDQIPRRFLGLLVDVFGYRRLSRDAYSGLMHLFIFYGFFAELIATSLIAIQEWLRTPFLKGSVYLWYSLLTDLFGLLAIAGIGMAIWRRLFMRPKHLNTLLDDWIALGLLLLVFVQGFAVEGARIAATELNGNPAMARWSPVGYVIALAMRGWTIDRLGAFYRFNWWFHAGTAFVVIGYLGFGKLNHIWYGLLNIFFRDLGTTGKLSYPDIEEAMEKDPESLETLGVNRIEQYTWKGLLDLDACTNCGRCQDVCPASLSGVALSPRKLIQDLKRHLSEVGTGLPGKGAADGSGGGEAAGRPPLFGERAEGSPAPAVLEEELWGCRTCGACMHECPVYIEHIPKMVDMRRYLVMMESKTSENARQFLKSMEERMHPWVGAQHNREEWYEGLDVKVFGKGEKAEYLFWVGCTGSMIDRNIQVSRAMVKVLKAAGVDFGILGPEESCTGDPARRAGGEFTFQMCAKKNIATLEGYGIKKIITTCPHTQLIADLIREGRLKPKRAFPSLTYHDPCYLGRHNGVFEAPREVLHRISGDYRELRRSRDRSLCCGAGGGYAWMDDSPKTRINHMRIEDVKASGSKVAAVSCPFCMQMFEDALKAKDPEKTIRAADIAELVAEALE